MHCEEKVSLSTIASIFSLTTFILDAMWSIRWPSAASIVSHLTLINVSITSPVDGNSPCTTAGILLPVVATSAVVVDGVAVFSVVVDDVAVLSVVVDDVAVFAVVVDDVAVLSVVVDDVAVFSVDVAVVVADDAAVLGTLSSTSIRLPCLSFSAIESLLFDICDWKKSSIKC